MMPAEQSIKKINELLNEVYGRITEPTLSTVILDLNSTFNTVCNVDKDSLLEYGASEYIKQIGALLRAFIKRHMDKKILILYNLESTYLKDHLGKNYLEFFYEHRPALADKIIKHYIGTLEEIATKTAVTVIDCKKFEPSVFVMYYLMTRSKEVLIVSRSRLILQLISEGGYFWDGTFMYNKKTPYSEILSYTISKAKNKFPKDLPYHLYPYYLCMRGIPTHKFPGVAGYGEVRTGKYLLENMTSIITLQDKVFNYSDSEYVIPLCFMQSKIEGNESIKTEFENIKKYLL